MDAGTAQPSDGGDGEYYTDLVEALGQWRDPAAITPLLGAVGSGNLAADALARFGDLAVPGLSRIVSQQDVGDISGAIFTLAKLVSGPVANAIQPVSDTSRRQIVTIARGLLTSQFLTQRAIPIISLLLATHDADLRARVVSLSERRQ
jgi:hypothetical protein